VLDRFFEPLVTTKAGHAGIGLAIAHRIVSEHGGELTVESGSAAGTVVAVSLPETRAI
jgi:signal transduction histidine kinase